MKERINYQLNKGEQIKDENIIRDIEGRQENK